MTGDCIKRLIPISTTLSQLFSVSSLICDLFCCFDLMMSSFEWCISCLSLQIIGALIFLGWGTFVQMLPKPRHVKDRTRIIYISIFLHHHDPKEKIGTNAGNRHLGDIHFALFCRIAIFNCKNSQQLQPYLDQPGPASITRELVPPKVV